MAYLDWAAVAAGMIGTALWAHKGPWAKWASAWWFASSALWLVFAWQHQLLALALEMAATLGLVGYGLWTWVLRGQARRWPRPSMPGRWVATRTPGRRRGGSARARSWISRRGARTEIASRRVESLRRPQRLVLAHLVAHPLKTTAQCRACATGAWQPTSRASPTHAQAHGPQPRCRAWRSRSSATPCQAGPNSWRKEAGNKARSSHRKLPANAWTWRASSSRRSASAWTTCLPDGVSR